jgi:hypothetical protein
VLELLRVYLLLKLTDGNVARKTTTMDYDKEKTNLEFKEEERHLEVECNNSTTCDFSALMPRGFDNEDLRNSCGFRAYPSFGTTSPINVFSSSNMKAKSWPDDPDLGSPNLKCNPKGPGIGNGGIPSAAFPNCEALGNVLILQNPHITTDRPNDDPNGGCITFDFYGLYHDDGIDPLVNDFGLLDIEDGATINVSRNLDSKQEQSSMRFSRCSNEGALVLSSSYSTAATLLCCDKFYQEDNLVVGTLTVPPKTVGNNGHFIARFYDEWYIVRSNLPGYILAMEVCLNGSGAVSFIDYTKCSSGSSSILPY